MSKTQYILARNDDESFITVILPGHQPLAVNSTHANFQKIVEHASDDNLEVDPNWFSAEKTIIDKFSRLSEQVTVANGKVFFDGDEIESALTKQIIRFLEEGQDDWEPLVKFFEKVQSNPNEHSRAQLYVWLDRHDITITTEGDFIGYKGVRSDRGSVHSGPGIVDGVPQSGHLPNHDGSLIEIARSDVHHDPSVGCSTGLHVGTHAYASSFGHTLLEVHVNPRDVVSVPTDCDAQKVRTCRYRVIQEIQDRYESAYHATSDVDDDFSASTPDEDAVDDYKYEVRPRWSSDSQGWRF